MTEAATVLPRCRPHWTLLVALAIVPGVGLGQDGGPSLELVREALERSALDEPTLRQIAADARTVADHASTDATRAEALFLRADALERAERFDGALEAYRASLRAAPGGRYGARARAREETLAEDEGDRFAGRAALARWRRQHPHERSPDALRALATEANAWAPSNARTEARMTAAEGLALMGRTTEATALWRLVADARETSTDTRALALHELARARIARGDAEQARDELVARGASAQEIATAARMARRATLARLAWLTLAAQLSWGLLACARLAAKGRTRALVEGWRRPLPLVHLSVLTGGGALLTRAYDGHDASHVWALGGAALGVYLAATAGSVAARERGDRWPFAAARAALAFCAVLSAGLLAMRAYDPGMLDGISL